MRLFDLGWVCFGVVLHHQPDDLPALQLVDSGNHIILACVKVAIALCSIFVCALKTCMLCLFCHEQEKERARVKEKLERYTKEGLVLLIDVLDLHLPRTGKKVKFLLGHNCVRLESQAPLTIH